MISPVIALTLFKRPKYTRAIFAYLEKCYGFSEMPCLVSQDYDAAHQEGCDEVWRLMQEFASEHSNVELFQQNPKLGIDLHKLAIIPLAFERGDYVIFLEDDLGLAPDTLRYFVAMGEKFKNDPSIASVSGYNRITAPDWLSRRDSPYGIEKRVGFVPWGFSVWKDRWDAMFSNGAAQYLADTGTQANGLFDHHWNGRGLGYIRPTVGRTNHMGWDGSEHTPSREWLMENEYSTFGAWQIELLDKGTVPWE